MGVAGIIRDVTDLKRAQEALRQSEERQKTILGNLGAYVFLKDTHCRYTYVNNMVCTLFGRGEAEIIGRGDESFFSPASVEEIMKSDRRVIERGETIAPGRDGSHLVGRAAPDVLGCKASPQGPFRKYHGPLRHIHGHNRAQEGGGSPPAE